jgi:hypothetical protein
LYKRSRIERKLSQTICIIRSERINLGDSRRRGRWWLVIIPTCTILRWYRRIRRTPILICHYTST